MPVVPYWEFDVGGVPARGITHGPRQGHSICLAAHVFRACLLILSRKERDDGAGEGDGVLDQ